MHRVFFHFLFFLSLTCGVLADTNTSRLWTNSIGMVFVPVEGTKVQFSIWETRNQDYEHFVNEGHWARMWPRKPLFSQTAAHPVVNVSWDDAKDFCIWLTQKEQQSRLIATNQVYRLPTDPEWSTAACLPIESAATPQKRSGGFRNIYPWGKVPYVTTGRNGEYTKFEIGDTTKKGNFLGGADGFKNTAPVGSFEPNPFHIYDLAGNVWEWCIDFADDGWRHVLRGGSWAHAPMSSAVRDYTLPDGEIGDVGFRCVLAHGPSNP